MKYEWIGSAKIKPAKKKTNARKYENANGISTKIWIKFDIEISKRANASEKEIVVILDLIEDGFWTNIYK